MYNVNELWNSIVEYGIATEEELQLVTCINGYNEQSINDIIYVRTGHHDIEQFLEEV